MAWPAFPPFVPSDLHEAVVLDKLDDMIELIRGGSDVNGKDPTGRTPLDYCATLGACYNHATPEEIENKTSLKKAKILLDNGASPNVADKCGWTVVHQCAWNGDLPLLEMAVRKGGNIHLRNHQNQLPVEMAAIRGHLPVVKYLEQQSCDLKSLCRVVIRDAMGKRTYNRINELPLPPLLKVFINYGNPYHGWEATLIPPSPWSNEELQEGHVGPKQVCSFICENAAEEFLDEHSDALKGSNMRELIEAFQSLYLWEAFKTVNFEEPLARTPRYTLEKREPAKEEEEENKRTKKWWTSLLGLQT